MPPTNTGNFASAIGGADPLQEAIARRATGQAGATQQVSPTAATFDPNMQPSAPGQAPQGQPAPTSPTPQASANLPFDPAELKMITGALVNRQKLLGSLQQAIVGVAPRGG